MIVENDEDGKALQDIDDFKLDAIEKDKCISVEKFLDYQPSRDTIIGNLNDWYRDLPPPEELKGEEAVK